MTRCRIRRHMPSVEEWPAVTIDVHMHDISSCRNTFLDRLNRAGENTVMETHPFDRHRYRQPVNRTTGQTRQAEKGRQQPGPAGSAHRLRLRSSSLAHVGLLRTTATSSSTASGKVCIRSGSATCRGAHKRDAGEPAGSQAMQPGAQSSSWGFGCRPSNISRLASCGIRAPGCRAPSFPLPC